MPLKNKVKGMAVLLSLFLTLAPTATFSAPKKEEKIGKRIISVATYNAENLFDTLHDEGKKDWTYLPLEVKSASKEALRYCKRLRNRYYRKTCFNLDWNTDTFHKKLHQIGKVIKTMDHGSSPDILVLQEIENINALTQLRDVALQDEGYTEVVLLEGPDGRGIDVGILSKFPLAMEPVLHFVDLSPHFPDRPVPPVTRSILDATFEIGKHRIRVLGNHWPSQSHDDDTRYLAAETLYKIAAHSSVPTIATGDFNTHPSDDPHGINHWLHNRDLDFYWLDAEREHYGDDYPLVMERGTHFYRGKWTSLDKIFLLENTFDTSCFLVFKPCTKPLYSTFQIVKKKFMLHDVTYRDSDTGEEVTYKDVPKRFSASRKEGFSDHLPVVMQFELR